MSEPGCSEAASPGAPRRVLLVLLLLFAASGSSALIYEVVWFQLLQFVIGSTAVSLGVLLATFMGGMGLGSIAGPRVISPRLHPLRVYALLEFALAVLGVAILIGLPLLDRLYSSWEGGGISELLVRAVACAICLLPPTILMGATLPVVARRVGTTPDGVSRLGLLYAANIAGAVFGCLLAGFYLLRVHDTAAATYAAAVTNAAVAAASWGLALWESGPGRLLEPAGKVVPRPAGAWPVYAAVVLSGACALAGEVVWTRLLAMMLGATVYAFSIILAVFLVGLGLGSTFGAVAARGSARPAMLLACCQWLLALAILWTAAMAALSLPFWPINPYLSRSPWFTFQLDLVRCLWALLPATCLWGASFPLALAAAADGGDPGRLVARVYAANTIGAIAGAVGTSLWLVPSLGTPDTQRVLIGLSALAGLLILGQCLHRSGRDAVPGRRSSTTAPRPAGALLLAACIAGTAAFAIAAVPATPWELVAFGRALPLHEVPWKLHYLGEGVHSSVAVTETPQGAIAFHVDGRTEASSAPQDMRLQRMLGHMPALFHPRPRSVLVVGCGAGVTAGCFTLHPAVERIVICEIEPLVPRAVAPHFARQNYNVVHDPRVRIVQDDARHYIRAARETFDVITSDPVHPWFKGAAALYTAEYLELCRRRLNPGGVICQWLPLYENSLPAVQSEIATFFEVFPEGTVWSNDQGGRGYDAVLLHQAGGLRVDADALRRRLLRPGNAAVLPSLAEVGFRDVVDLLGTYGGRASDLRTWLEHAAINRDSNLRLQYLAGIGSVKDQGQLIHEELLRRRRFPDDIFVGSGYDVHAVRHALERGKAAPVGVPHE